MLLSYLSLYSYRSKNWPIKDTKKLPKLPGFSELKEKLDAFKNSLPLTEMMGHQAMEDRHWKQLETLTMYKYQVTSETKLKEVMDSPMLHYKEEIEVRILYSVLLLRQYY